MATSCPSLELFMLWFCYKYRKDNSKDSSRTNCPLFSEDRHPFAWKTSCSWIYFLFTPHIFQRSVLTITGERLTKGHSRSDCCEMNSGNQPTHRQLNDSTHTTCEERSDDITLPLSPRQQRIASCLIAKWEKWPCLLQTLRLRWSLLLLLIFIYLFTSKFQLCYSGSGVFCIQK